MVFEATTGPAWSEVGVLSVAGEGDEPDLGGTSILVLDSGVVEAAVAIASGENAWGPELAVAGTPVGLSFGADVIAGEREPFGGGRVKDAPLGGRCVVDDLAVRVGPADGRPVL